MKKKKLYSGYIFKKFKISMTLNFYLKNILFLIFFAASYSLHILADKYLCFILFFKLSEASQKLY